MTYSSHNWLPPTEAAKRLNVTPRTLRRRAVAGKLSRKEHKNGYLYAVPEVNVCANVSANVNSNVNSNVNNNLLNSLISDFEYTKNHTSTFDPSVSLDLYLGNKPIALIPLADQHIGAPGVRYDLLIRDANLIAETEGMYCINLGDTINNFIVGRLTSVAAFDDFAVTKQVKILGAYLEKISSNKSLLAMLSGNHELWTYALSRMDPTGNLAKNLNIFYDKYELFLNISVGNTTYKIHARHRYTGNSMFNDLHSAIRLYSEGDHSPFSDSHPDIVILGHTHTYSYSKMKKNGKFRIFAVTGSYKTSDSYAKEKGYNAASPLYPVFILNPLFETIEIHDNIEFVANSYLPWLRSNFE
jgi:hypothetical protein